jgi:hypothetical protein
MYDYVGTVVKQLKPTQQLLATAAALSAHINTLINAAEA